tara:strand:- start:161 stop:310 length:150 start_codon:yes stop_codon:yes gene_type:complete
VTKNHYTPEKQPKMGKILNKGRLILLINISFGGGEGGKLYLNNIFVPQN